MDNDICLALILMVSLIVLLKSLAMSISQLAKLTFEPFAIMLMLKIFVSLL